MRAALCYFLLWTSYLLATAEVKFTQRSASGGVTGVGEFLWPSEGAKVSKSQPEKTKVIYLLFKWISDKNTRGLKQLFIKQSYGYLFFIFLLVHFLDRTNAEWASREQTCDSALSSSLHSGCVCWQAGSVRLGAQPAAPADKNSRSLREERNKCSLHHPRPGVQFLCPI